MASDTERLMRTARTLRATPVGAKRKGARPPLPPLLLLTDPARTPDVLRAASRLPRGAGVVFRAFGAADALETARRLSALCRRRGLVLLVGADANLAALAGADGVHLPERLLARGGRLRRTRPAWLITGAAHGATALRRARLAGLDAALLSPAFPSRSPSAGRPLGPIRFASLVRGAGLPVYGLGGVNVKNAPRLRGAGASGLAAVDALRGA